MRALQFDFGWARLAAAKLLGAIGDRGYLSDLGPVTFAEVPDPKLPRDDWVILETRYAGICGSDLKQVFLEGAIDNPLTSFISFPHVMGHEIAGTVVEAGKGVTRVRRGDRVVVNPWLSCASRGLEPCRACAAGKITFCERFTEGDAGPGMHLGTSRAIGGGFAPYLTAHESMVFPVPEAVSFEEAALADPFSVSLHAVLKAPPSKGDTVLVFGCGPLGMAAIHVLARLFPGVTVLAVDLSPHAAEPAQAFGAARLLTGGGASLIEAVAEITQARVHKTMAGLPWLLGGVARVYDTVGSARTLEAGVRIVRPQGTIVMVGVANPARFEWTPLYFKEVHLVGSSGCSFETIEGKEAHAFAHYLDLVAARRVDPAPMITHRFPLPSYRDAFLTARDKARHRSIKVLFDFAERP